MSTLTNKHGIVGGGLGLLFVLSATGCGPQFDPPSELRSLRILAVKKDDPYLRPAAPSAAVADDASGAYEPNNVAHMTLALQDARLEADRQGELQKLWFAGCNNPLGDNYFTCLLNVWLSFKVWSELGPFTDRGPGRLPDGEGWPNQEDLAQIGTVRAIQFLRDTFPDLYDQAASQTGSAGAGALGGLGQQELIDQVMAMRIGIGDTFDYTVPAWVIDEHQPPKDKDIPRYGLSQVFLAVCDGEIGVSPGWESVDDPMAVLTDATRGFPLTCYERGTKKERGPDHFMVSYSNLYVYDELKNQNPIVDGVRFAGQRVDDSAVCIGEACQLAEDVSCELGSLAPRVERCARNAAKGCKEYTVQPILSESKNFEIDALMSRLGGGDAQLREQMWIRFYADAGDMERDTRRLQDATEGWFSDTETKWTVPEQGSRVAHIWTVVYDNRGGVDWARVSVCID